MSQTFTLGSGKDNDIYISEKEFRLFSNGSTNYNSLKKHHANIIILDNDTILLEDCSDSGTYVNRFRIKKKQITFDDNLQFSDYKAQLNYFLRQNVDGNIELRKGLKDFSQEFDELRPVYTQFLNNIKKVKRQKGSLQIYRIVTV